MTGMCEACCTVCRARSRPHHAVPHLRFEAHVKHAIRLVKHQVSHAPQVGDLAAAGHCSHMGWKWQMKEALSGEVGKRD